MPVSRVPQQARGEERRERILRATLAVIGRSGIGAVTHRSVAEEAGVPLGSLTYWFGTKDDLLREALRRFVADEAERLKGIAGQLGTGADPTAVAESYATVLEGDADDEQIAQFELYLEAARNPALRDIAAEAERLKGIAEQLGTGADPTAVAESYATVLEGNAGDEQIAQFELYLEAARNPALRDIAAESFRAYEEVAVAALRAAGVAEPERFAPLFVSLADGIGLRRMATGASPPLDEVLLGLFRGVRD